MAWVVRDFERLHPGVRVRVQQIPWTVAHEKPLTAYLGRATPEVSLASPPEALHWVDVEREQRLDA